VVARQSHTSFLFALVAWITLVLIVPRIGMMISEQLVSVPTVSEMKSLQEAFVQDRWNKYGKLLQQVWTKRNASLAGLSPGEQEAKRDEMQWGWAEEDNTSRNLVEQDIEEHSRMLQENQRNKKVEQERAAVLLSRFSPVASYQLAMMNFAHTDIGLKQRYEDDILSYRKLFNQFREQKQREVGDIPGIRITADPVHGLKIQTGREIALDLSGVPEFKKSPDGLAQAMKASLPDIGLLSVTALLAFAAAFIMFLRYDVR